MSQIDTIKAKVSPADAGRHYGLKTSRNGMALCPFHNDTNPSMNLYDDHFYRQPNGQWLKSIKFKLPIIEEDMSLSLDNDEHVETVCLLERGVVTGGTRIGGYLFSHGTREQDDIIELPVMEKAHMLGKSV